MATVTRKIHFFKVPQQYEMLHRNKQNYIYTDNLQIKAAVMAHTHDNLTEIDSVSSCAQLLTPIIFLNAGKSRKAFEGAQSGKLKSTCTRFCM